MSDFALCLPETQRKRLVQRWNHFLTISIWNKATQIQTWPFCVDSGIVLDWTTNVGSFHSLFCRIPLMPKSGFFFLKAHQGWPYSLSVVSSSQLTRLPHFVSMKRRIVHNLLTVELGQADHPFNKCALLGNKTSFVLPLYWDFYQYRWNISLFSPTKWQLLSTSLLSSPA